MILKIIVSVVWEFSTLETRNRSSPAVQSVANRAPRFGPSGALSSCATPLNLYAMLVSNIDSSSEGEIGFKKCTSPSIGPLPATVFVLNPDGDVVAFRSVESNIIVLVVDMLPEVMVGSGDGNLLPLVVGDELIVDPDVVVVVRHASIVPEEERRARVRDGFSQLFSRLSRWEK